MRSLVGMCGDAEDIQYVLQRCLQETVEEEETEEEEEDNNNRKKKRDKNGPTEQVRELVQGDLD